MTSDIQSSEEEQPREEFETSVTALYEEAKRTIAQWCRDADESARRIIANAETSRRLAHAEAERVRESARLEAGRILAEAEARAGEVKAGMQLSGVERGRDIDVLQAQVERLGKSVDFLLDALDGVLHAVAVFSPGRSSGSQRELQAGPPPPPPDRAGP